MKQNMTKVKQVIKELQKQYGSQEKVADILGYEKRQYCRIRTNINNGAEINFRTEEYIILKAQSLGITV